MEKGNHKLSRYRTAAVTALASAAFALSLAGCGAGLSGSSTCKDYLGASSQDQQTIVEKLAAQYQKPDYATPLGFPEVAYWCASEPSATLDHFFQIASG